MVYPHLFRTEHSETKTTNSSYGEYYKKGKKIPCQPVLIKLLQFIDSNRENFFKNLEKLIEIPSVNGDLKMCNKVLEFVEGWVKKLGMYYEIFDIGFKKTSNGQKIRYPRVLLSSIGNDIRKKVICVYTHLDVMKPNIDKWRTDPFKATRDDKKIYGCGVAAGKSVLLCWFHMVLAFQTLGIDLPVNLRFVIECNHYSRSAGLSDFISSKKQEIFQNIDHVILSQFEWLGMRRPCIIYGTVGVMHYMLTAEKVEGSNTDPKNDLEEICSRLTDDQGNIIIDDYHKLVRQITPEEEKMYKAISDFDIDSARECLLPHQKNWSKEKLLMYYWRLPTLWLDEIKSCTCPQKNTTIYKRHLIMKTVPSQIIQRSEQVTSKFIEKVKRQLRIKNKIECKMFSGTRFWLEDVRAPQYEAARRAIIQIYKEEPNMIREDSCSRIVTILDLVFERTVVMLPICTKGSNSGAENENILEKNFFEATKVFAAYMFQVAAIK